jgi:hypothetical protein
MRRRRKPELHHGDEAVAAGNGAGVVAQIGKQADSLLNG